METKEVTTREFAKMIGVTAQHLTGLFQRIRLYEQTVPDNDKHREALQRRIEHIKQGFGDKYLSHEKMRKVWIVTISTRKAYRTEIFESYEAFLQRSDKTVNGITANVAAVISDWEKDNETNQGCFNSTRCKGSVDCLDSYCLTDCTDCTTSSFLDSCNDCSYCTVCVGCVGLTHASNQRFIVVKK